MVVLQTYGKRQIVMEKDEVESIKKFEDPGMFLIGFKPMGKLKVHHHNRPSVFLYPEEEQVKGQASSASHIFQSKRPYVSAQCVCDPQAARVCSPPC